MDLLFEIDRRVKKINELKPFEGFYLQHIRQFHKNETAFSSNAIEGNTFSREETRATFEDGLTIGGHPIRDFYEIEGLGKAYDFMFELIKKSDLSESEILRFHHLYSYNIPNFASPGEYRKTEAAAGGSKKTYPGPGEVPSKMQAYIEWTNKQRGKNHPVIFAAEAHRRFMNICPFSDGNGKIGRLIMNTFLLQDKLFPVSIPVAEKKDYFDKLENNDVKGFAIYIAELELQTLKNLMKFMHLA